VVVAATCFVVALMTVFAIGLSSSQANARHTIESEVHERAVLAASLLDSVFQSAANSESQASQLFGSATVSEQVLDSHLGGGAYMVIADASGRILAASSGVDAQARGDLAASDVLSYVREGRPYGIGDVEPYGKGTVIDFAVTFPTAYGTRAIVAGVDPTELRQFAEPELRSIPGVPGARSTLLDGNDVILATTNPAAVAGTAASEASQVALRHPSGTVDGKYFAQSELANSTYHIVLAAPSGTLFAPVSGVHRWLPWVLFVAFALVAALALVLGYRAGRNAQRTRRMNERLAALNAELSEVNAELSRSNDELDQFASIASHDLQEPLRKVRTYTQQLSVMEADHLSEKGQDYLWRANAAGARMQTLIEDLLRFARVGTQAKPFAPTDLGQVAAEVLGDLATQVQESGAEVTIGTLPTIDADALQMRQLLQNLLSNALKFRRDEVPARIAVDGVLTGAKAELTVRDNGIGFDPRYSQRIFRVFERLHGRTEYPGTGIGLALCRKIAERHGGSIQADGQLGVGSTFTVVLPVHQKPSVIDVRTPVATGRAGDGTRQATHV
jgi:signal transduction histidine kinase